MSRNPVSHDWVGIQKSFCTLDRRTSCYYSHGSSERGSTMENGFLSSRWDLPLSTIFWVGEEFSKYTLSSSNCLSGENTQLLVIYRLWRKKQEVYDALSPISIFQHQMISPWPYDLLSTIWCSLIQHRGRFQMGSWLGNRIPVASGCLADLHIGMVFWQTPPPS